MFLPLGCPCLESLFVESQPGAVSNGDMVTVVNSLCSVPFPSVQRASVDCTGMQQTFRLIKRMKHLNL